MGNISNMIHELGVILGMNGWPGWPLKTRFVVALYPSQSTLLCATAWFCLSKLPHHSSSMLCPKLHITNILSLAFAPIYHKYLLRLPYQITFSQDSQAGLSC
jgi:hypothetical protein